MVVFQVYIWGLALWRIMQERRYALCARAGDSRYPCGEPCRNAGACCAFAHGCQVYTWGLALWRIMQGRKCALCARALGVRFALGVSPCGEPCRSAGARCALAHGIHVCTWGLALWRIMQERRCALCARAWVSGLHLGVSPCGESCRSASAHFALAHGCQVCLWALAL